MQLPTLLKHPSLGKDKSLVGYWPLDGDTKDYGNRTFVNDPCLKAYYRLEDLKNTVDGVNISNFSGGSFVEAKFGSGFNFGANNTYGFLEKSSDFGMDGSKITILCRVKLEAEIQSDAWTFVYFSSDASPYVGYSIGYEYNSGVRRLKFSRIRLGVAEDSIYANVPLGTDDFHTLALTWDGTTLKSFISGSLSASSTPTGDGDSGYAYADVILGAGRIIAGTVGNHSSITLDDVAIFDRALSADEVYKASKNIELFILRNRIDGIVSGATKTPVRTFTGSSAVGYSMDGTDDYISFPTGMDKTERITVNALITPQFDHDIGNEVVQAQTIKTDTLPGYTAQTGSYDYSIIANSFTIPSGINHLDFIKVCLSVTNSNVYSTVIVGLCSGATPSLPGGPMDFPWPPSNLIFSQTYNGPYFSNGIADYLIPLGGTAVTAGNQYSIAIFSYGMYDGPEYIYPVGSSTDVISGGNAKYRPRSTTSWTELAGDWFFELYYSTPAYNQGSVIANKYDGTNQQYSLQLYNNAGTPQVEFFTHDGTTKSGVSANYSTRNGTETLLSGTYDGTNYSIFANGKKLASSASTTSPIRTGSSMYIGKRSDDTRRFKGIVRELSIFNRALSIGEIGDYYDWILGKKYKSIWVTFGRILTATVTEASTYTASILSLIGIRVLNEVITYTDNTRKLLARIMSEVSTWSSTSSSIQAIIKTITDTVTHVDSVISEILDIALTYLKPRITKASTNLKSNTIKLIKNITPRILK